MLLLIVPRNAHPAKLYTRQGSLDFAQTFPAFTRFRTSCEPSMATADHSTRSDSAGTLQLYVCFSYLLLSQECH